MNTTKTNLTAEHRMNPHEKWLRKLAADLQSATPPTTICVVHTVLQAANEIGRLQEVVTIPIITPDSPSALCIRVLAEHEKGHAVNAQDLINALMWRVGNQRRELARVNEQNQRLLNDIPELTCGDPHKVCPNCRENVS